MNGHSRTVKRQHGFTIIQMLITLAIMAIVSTFGVLGIRSARAEFRLRNSARVFASYIEKARTDSIRRHAAPGDESSVETFGPGTNTYEVSMDFGSGAVEKRIFQLESGLTFETAAKKVSFDWRGRIAKFWVFQIYSDFLNHSIPVDVSGSGDITVDEQHFPDLSIPEITIAEVTGDVDPDPEPPVPENPPESETNPDPTSEPTPTPTPSNGNGNGSGGSGGGSSGGGGGNESPSPTPTPTPTPPPDPNAEPTPVMPQCVTSISPSTLSLSQGDPNNQTGTATVTMTNATGVRTISALQLGNGNSLVIGLSLVRIDGNGSSVISVTTKNGAGNRGVFIVEVSTDPACGSKPQLTVSVSN